MVDYALRRRAVLAQVTSGRTGLDEVCDAGSYLIQAAKYHGVPTESPCPVCRKETLTHVHWIYGDELDQVAGTARQPAELERLEQIYSEFDVHQVEVCRTCSWNHLVMSFVLGHGGERAAKSRSRALT